MGHPRVAVSTWTLHRVLSRTYPSAPARPPQEAPGEGTLTLAQVVEEARGRGFSRFEVCHFHLGERDELAPDATRQTLLVDEGDLTGSPEDAAWVDSWLARADEEGYAHARVIAGKTRGEGSVRLAAERLSALADAHPGLRVITENWFDVLATPADVHALMAAAGGKVGLCLDFGNWTGDAKYADLAEIARYAETCHAKCDFDGAGEIVCDDYDRCLALAEEAGYRGPYVVVNGGAGDPWAALEKTRDHIARRLEQG